MSTPPLVVGASHPFPPAMTPAARGRARGGRRPLVRWARRLFRREWRQQLLVVGLLVAAVAAAVAGSTAAINAASDPTGRFGTGGARAHIDASDAAAAEQSIADVRAQFGDVDVIAHATVSVPGSVQRVDVRDQDPTGALGHPMLAQVEGRYPTVAGEVALTADAATWWDAQLGDRVEVGGAIGTATLVGIVENPAELSDDFVLVAPGALPSPESFTVLVDPAARVQAAADGRGSFGLEVEGSDREAVAVGVLAVSTLAMAMVALIASAGFVVIAQRRQRQLGLLAAIGANGRHIRLVAVANGLLVGGSAAVVGGGLGVGAWMVAAPAVESAADHRIERVDLPWTVIAALLAIAVVMATLAAWWPARATSRVPVMASLAGRPVPPQPVHRSVLVAVLLVGGGIAAVAFSDPGDSDTNALLLVGGLLAVVLGAVFLAPAVIRLVASAAARLPFAPRLALRDLARSQSRAAAALAAIAFGVGIATSVIVVASANQDGAAEGNLSDQELLIRVGDARTGPDPDRSVAEVARLDTGAAAVVAALGEGVAWAPLDVAFNAGDRGPAAPEPVGVVQPVGEHMVSLLGYAYVESPDLLALYDIDPADVDASADLLTSRSDEVSLLDVAARPDVGDLPSAVQRAGLPTHDAAPNSLITESALARNGWVRARAGWIVEMPSALTPDQIAAARDAAVAVGLAIEVRDTQDALQSLRTGATIAGAVLVLAVVAMAIGLLRGESARDIRTMTATGAGARTRRALTATTAAALTVAGTGLGVVLASGVLTAAYRSRLGDLIPVPVTDLGMLVLGLPIVATVVGWVLAGREPTDFSRRPLE